MSDGMFDQALGVTVTVKAADLNPVLEWCRINLTNDELLNTTVRTSPNGTHVIRCQFVDKHHASLFKLFWG